MNARLVESPDSPLSDARVWMAQVDSLSADEVEELHAHLDSAERGRAARFHFPRDRQNYVATRGLLRCLLGALLDEEAAALVLTYGAHGKPALAANGQSQAAIRFNATHSGGWAMFAVASNREVGIDLEAAARLDDDNERLAALAQRILSGRELKRWLALPEAAARRDVFLRAWTRKEAYTKALGKGLFDGFRQVEVVLDLIQPTPSFRVRETGDADNQTSSWVLHDLHAPAGFSAALAVEA